jgi:hypothetical protein
MIRFGPAGWVYSDWAGIVYPASTPRGFDPLAGSSEGWKVDGGGERHSDGGVTPDHPGGRSRLSSVSSQEIGSSMGSR